MAADDLGTARVAGSRLAVSGARVAVAASLGFVVVGAFLPWIHTGAATRNSFGLVRAARRLGVVDHDLGELLLAAWYFVPLLAAVALLAMTVRRNRLAGGAAAALGIVVGLIAVVVAASPAETGPGPLVASAASMLAIAGGITLVLAAGRTPRGSREQS